MKVMDNFVFKRTCFACPEQYDVYYKGEQCAYVRLRGGRLLCEMPDCGGELVYSFNFDNDMGMFLEDKDREYHLEVISKIIFGKLGLTLQESVEC